jgi:hypothetical protein
VPEKGNQMNRKEFITRMFGAVVGATAATILPTPRTRVLKSDFFTYGEKFSLFMLHNRLREGQRAYVWIDGTQHRFTVDDNTSRLPTDRNWICLGELRWVVDAKGEYFEHHLVPNFPRIN